MLTAELRVDNPQAAQSGGALSGGGLSNLHSALSSTDEKPSGEAIVENLRETWIAPKPDEYYEDETEDGLTGSFAHNGEMPEISDRAEVEKAEAASPEDPFDIELEEQEEQKVQDVIPSSFEFVPVVTPRDPEDEDDAEESILDAYLAQQENARASAKDTASDEEVSAEETPAEKEKEPSIRDTIRSELKAVRTPITPSADGADAEPVTIPRFRHRGWSYDLASAAGWNTDAAGDAGAAAEPEAEAETPTGTVYIGPTATPEVVVDEASGDSDEAEQSSVVAFTPQGGQIDASMIDEEMLREVVADILREELSGALGERITRNVRKLVRREIHRAMMTQDYD